jgi:hypothetical protein
LSLRYSTFSFYVRPTCVRGRTSTLEGAFIDI